MGVYDSTGAFNAAVNDNTGVGRYSASGALRVTLVSGTSYVGLYAADGSMNVVLDSSGQGLYHPSGAVRGVSISSGQSGLYAPNGAYYFANIAVVSAPVNTSLPVISGTPNTEYLLTASTGVWSGSPFPTFTYQWNRGGTPISGANTPYYIVRSADVGENITVTVTATNSEGSASATSTAVVGVAGYSPTSLFASSEQGAIYDPSDFNRYMGNLGSELVSNGDFSGGSTGWTLGTGWSISSGVASVVAGGSNVDLSTSVSLTAGKSYKITLTISNYVAGSITPRFTGGSNVIGNNFALANGTYSQILTAVSGNTTFTLRTNSAAELSVDNISVKEVIDISTATMWQDVQATIPVTALEQPVGRIRDLSRTPPASALGSELITNGDFSAGTGWTFGTGWSIASGEATRSTQASTTYLTYGTTIPFKAGAAYLISFDVIAVSAGTVFPRITGGTNLFGTSYTSPGSYSQIMVAAVGNNTFQMACATNGSCTIDNVSVKEILTGNDAFRVTDAGRPVLSARYNLALQTEKLTAADWTVSRSAVSLAGINPPSVAQTAWKLEDNGSTVTTSRVYSTANITTVTSLSYNLSFYLKGGTLTEAFLRRPGGANDANGVYYNTSTGLATNVGVVTSSSMTSVGDGWWRCEAVMTAAATTSIFYIGLALSGTTSFQLTVGTQYLYIAAPDIRETNGSVGLPAYQRVGNPTAGNSSTAGNPDYDAVGFRPYLDFDGTDDGLGTASIDFSGTNEVSLFAGLKKDSEAALGMFVELSATAVSNNGVFYLTAPNGASANNYVLASKGTVSRTATSSASYPAPITNVITAIGDIDSDSAVIRVNGTQDGNSTSDQGDGPFGNHPMYVGSRANSSLRFNGRLYSLIVLGREATSQEITDTEAWVNNKTGAY